MGPPSSGATTVFAILKQLERFDLAALGPDSPDAWHLIAESMRLAYADREAYLGDPDFVPRAGRRPDRRRLSRRAARARSRRDRAIAHVEAGTPPGAPPVGVAAGGRGSAGTSHFVAVDRAGNVASLTSTIESAFGSGLTVNGYFLNNELTDFSFAPERERRAGRQPRRGRQEAAQLDVADHRLRPGRRASGSRSARPAGRRSSPRSPRR